MTTAAKRKTLLAKLTPGKDTDLIDWLESIPDGEKNQEIKNTLRAGLGLAQVDYSQPPDDLTRLRDSVESGLRDMYQFQQATLATLQQLNGNGLPDRLNGLETTLQAELTRLGQWVDYLNTQIEGRTFVTPADAPPMQIEEAPRVDDETVNERTDKLRKMSW